MESARGVAVPLVVRPIISPQLATVATMLWQRCSCLRTLFRRTVRLVVFTMRVSSSLSEQEDSRNQSLSVKSPHLRHRNRISRRTSGANRLTRAITTGEE